MGLNELNKKDLITIIKQYEQTEKNLLAKIEKIETEFRTRFDTEFQGRLISVERGLYMQEQYSRRECVELVNIPEVEDDKNLEKTVVGIFKEAGVEVGIRDFHAIHRLKSKSTVIAKLVNRRDVIGILRSKKKVRGLSNEAKVNVGIEGNPTIYINESLCPQYRKLFGICNALYKAEKIVSFYSINGSIKVKMFDDGTTSISHISDMYNLFGRDVIVSINEKFLASRAPRRN